MKKINVLLIMPEIYHGGAEKQFRNIVARIDREKFNVTVMIEHSYKSRDSFLEKEFISEHPDIRFISLWGLNSVDGRIKRYCSSCIINFELLPYLISRKPDIVIGYTLLSLKIAKLSKLLGAIFIYGERNAGDYPDRFYRNQKIFLNATKRIVANSKSARRKLEEHQLKVDYIPNGVETVNRIPEEKNTQFIIVVPARIAKVKNQEFLIKAISEIDEKIIVQFVGKVEDFNYKKYLESLADELNVKKQIEFLDYTSDVREMYRKASLIVLPSKSEGFSNVVLESYLYGRICLVSDIEMNRDIGAPSQRYFNLNNIVELENQIRDIINLPVEIKNNEIEQNYKYAKDNFSMEKMTLRYEELFENICGEKNIQCKCTMND